MFKKRKLLFKYPGPFGPITSLLNSSITTLLTPTNNKYTNRKTKKNIFKNSKFSPKKTILFSKSSIGSPVVQMSSHRLGLQISLVSIGELGKLNFISIFLPWVSQNCLIHRPGEKFTKTFKVRKLSRFSEKFLSSRLGVAVRENKKI